MLFPLTIAREGNRCSRAAKCCFVRIVCLLAALVVSAAFGAAQAQTGNGTGIGTIIVYVVGQDGDPINHIFQVALTREGFTYTNLFHTTGPNGVTEFTQLPLAEYRVTASAPGYDDADAEVDITGGRNAATVIVTVEAKDDDSSRSAPAKGLVLAPKAKKEVTEGMAAMQAGRYDDARQHLEAAYKLAPGNPEVNDVLGEVYLSTKNLDKAQGYIQHAISIDPDNVSALTDMGWLRVQQKDYVSAEITLQRAVTLAPRNWVSHWLLGVSYLHLNEGERAQQEATAAIRAGKAQASDAQYLLGESLAVLGRRDDAIKALQQLLKDSPDNSNAPAAKALIARLQAAGAPVTHEQLPDSAAAPSAPAESPKPDQSPQE